MQHAVNAGAAGVIDHRGGVVSGLAGVYNDRSPRFRGERELLGECPSLQIARRMIVVVVEPALADRDRSTREVLANARGIAGRVKPGRVMRVHAGGPVDKRRVQRGNAFRAIRRA